MSDDAHGLADLMRVNKFRAVGVKSSAAMRDRALSTVREQLRGQSLDARNAIWAILQGEGLNPPGLSNPAFRRMLAEMLDDPEVGPLLEPLAAVVEHLDRQVAALDRAVAARAKAPTVRRRPTGVPGVGRAGRRPARRADLHGRARRSGALAAARAWGAASG